VTAVALAPQGAIVADVDHAAAAADPHATLQGFTLDDLAVFTREGSFPDGDSPDMRSFYVGRDDVHGVLKYLFARCSRALKMNMFGYDDDELNTIIESLIADAHVYVQGTLDKSQAGGVHEKKILAGWSPEMRSSFAIGTSATHQISHTKGGVLDGVVAFNGSTNWSGSGEGAGIGLHGDANAAGYKAQNNTLDVYVNAVEIVKFATELDEEHATVLAQLAKAAAA
jgi:hypothetical protein